MIIKAKAFSDVSYRRNVITYTIEGLVSMDRLLKAVSARATAKCNPTDVYDRDFGIALARSRAFQKYYKKIEKMLVNYSYRHGKQIKRKRRTKKKGDDLLNYLRKKQKEIEVLAKKHKIDLSKDI